MPESTNHHDQPFAEYVLQEMRLHAGRLPDGALLRQLTAQARDEYVPRPGVNPHQWAARLVVRRHLGRWATDQRFRQARS